MTQGVRQGINAGAMFSQYPAVFAGDFGGTGSAADASQQGFDAV
jgi:hypothetical protein